MSLAQSIGGFVFFLVAGGVLRLHLEKRSSPVNAPVEQRYDVNALAGLALRLSRGGMEVREAADAVTATVADSTSGLVSPEDRRRLAYLVAERVHQLQST